MKMYFESVYRYICIFPTNIVFVTTNLIDKSNYTTYTQKMKHNKNRFIVYSLDREQDSEINLDTNKNHNLAKNANMNLNTFPIATQFLSFCILFHTQIRKEIYVFIHFLCVVHGLQIKYLNQESSNWHASQLNKAFLSRIPFFIQVTDIVFPIKPILNDIRDVLIGPLLITIDFITFSKVKNYVYENCSGFIRWISFIFQKFVLQIDEDGEQVLMRIQKNDVFRQQKPGAIPFFKKAVIYNEDYTFLKFRHLKRKTYACLRIITLVMLPFIIYKTNQKLGFEPGLPKLTYIVSNCNRKKFQNLHHKYWENVLHKNDLNQLFTKLNTNLSDDESLNLVKPEYCDKTRIISLWNANKLINKSQQTTKTSDLKSKSSIFSIDSFLLNKKKKNYAYQASQNFEKYSFFEDFFKKKYYEYFNENNISAILYKYALFLIKPRDILSTIIDNIDAKTSSINKNSFVMQQYFISNKKNKLQYQRFHTNTSFFQKNFQKKYLQNLRNMIFVYFSKISLDRYSPFFYKSRNPWEYNIEENQFLKENIQKHKISDSIFSKRESGKDAFYEDVDVIILIIKLYLVDLIKSIQYLILSWLNISLGISRMSCQGLPFKYKYINSLVNSNNTILYSQKNEFHSPNENLILDVDILTNFYNDSKNRNLVKTSFNLDKKNHLISELDVNLFRKPLFLKKLHLLDNLYSISINNLRPDKIDNLNDKMMKIIPLFYSHFCEKIDFLQKSTNCNEINLHREILSNLKKNIYNIISHEQDQICSTCSQFIENLYSSCLVGPEVNNRKNQNQDILLNKELQMSSLKSMPFISIKSSPINFNVVSMLNDQICSDQIDPLNSSDLWQSLIKIFKKNLQLNQSIHIHKDSIMNNNTEKILNMTPESEILSDDISKKYIFSDYIYNQVQILKEYNLWFFTPEWWSLVNISSKKILLVIWQDILDSIESNILDIKISFLKRSNLCKKKIYEYNIHQDNNLVFQGVKNINLIIFEKLQTSLYNFPLSIWENVGCSSFRMNLIGYWGSLSSFIAYYWFSLILGGSSIILWMMFERVRNLTYLSWNTELDILVLANFRGNTNPMLASYSKNKKNKLKEQYNLSLYKWSAWLRLLFSNHIGSKLQNIWLYNRSTVDMYGDRRDLAFELIVGETSFVGLTLSNLDENIAYNIGYESTKQEGLDYLKQLTNTHYKWYNKDNRNIIHNQRFISFAFYKTHSTSLDSWQVDNSLGLTKQKYLPISLQLSDLYSKAILLIGPKDTGKSYVVKSIAADANLPLIYIAIDKLIDVLEFEDSTLEGESSLYFLRENIFKFYTISSFIKTMGSCVIWMPTIENIHSSQNYMSKTRKYCTLLILRFLLKDITTTLASKQNIMFFASCEDTSYLDPGFISVKRFNRFINLRLPSNVRRPQIFANFLKNKNLDIKSEVCWYSEFSNSTMGFNLRDLTVFANQAFLTSLEQQNKSLQLDDIRLVLYRGLRANENSSRASLSQDVENLQYKIGRAIVQTTLVRPNPMIPLRYRYDLWKPRFYYLSKAYLQPDFSEPTVTQLNILPHILSCLAGLAAIDAWLLLNKTILKENSFSFNTEISHDLDLAVNLFESIFKEFPYLDICNINYQNTTMIPKFQKMQNLVNLDQGNDVVKKAFDAHQAELDFTPSEEGTSSEGYLEDLFSDISWSSRGERLNLSRNVLFDLLKKIDEPLSIFSSLRYFGRISSNDMLLETQRPYAGLYHRSWDIMKSEIPKDLDYAFYGMLAKQRITTIGLPVLSNQLMEYEPPENDLLLLCGRPVWNPAATFLRNLIFRQRQLFANEELLSILYLMYQSQRNRPSIGKKNRRKEVWTPDAYLERLAMNNNLQKDSEKKVRIEMPQTFNMFKRLAHVNATFRRPQAEVPNNSEMSFIKSFIALNRFSRYSFTEDIFYQQNILKEEDAKLQELLTYGSILESYHYLLKFFVRHQYLLKSITNLLYKKDILYKEDLQKIIYSSLNSNSNDSSVTN